MDKEEILRMIEEEGVEFIRLQFTDIFGNLKNIAVTPSQMDRVFGNQYSFDGSGLYGGICAGDDTLYLYPDFSSFVILPWRPQQGKVAKMICDVKHRDGSDCPECPRTILKKVIDIWSKKGYSFKIDPECEFFLFHTNESGKPTTETHDSAGYLDVGPVDFGENARRDMVLNLEEMGFEVESSHHEKAPAQHEIDFKESDALLCGDSIMTFRFAVRSIAARFGLYATFMPKPITDLPGSGMHINIAVYKDKKPLFDLDDGINPNKAASCFAAGIMEHAKALFAITNPIVNSYKRVLTRFARKGETTWTTKGENALYKLEDCFGSLKCKIKFPDTSANPYLALAVCIAAGMDGIEKGILESGFTGENCHLPENLKEAVTALRNDYYIVDTLGSNFVNLYTRAKMDEWNEYMTQVSEWEIDKYLFKI